MTTLRNKNNDIVMKDRPTKKENENDTACLLSNVLGSLEFAVNTMSEEELFMNIVFTAERDIYDHVK
jgi:hypothetical protein